jgi:Xaa-Pro aminopeptidase
MSDRVDRLRESLEEPLLVSAPTNVRYLTGFESSNAALLVEPERVRLFADFRYAEGARRVEGVEFEETKRALYPDLATRLRGRIGFEPEALSYAHWLALADADLELVPRSGLVERLRAVKDDSELDALRRASEITSEAYARLAEERFVGRTERELAWRMDVLLRELGGHDLGFPTHLNAGPNSAQAHALSGDRPVGPGETVIVDASAAIDGYCSDCTRTFATGPLPDDLARAYEVCLAGQLAGLEAVRAGAAARDADAAARDRIAADGLGEAFGHGLGHGVGLLVHEAPVLRPESSDVLEAGNVVTVEPGVYLSGRGGIRIEDLVVVTEDGPEVLTPFTKELVTVR